MRKVFAYIVGACFLFFALGWIGVIYGYINQSFYLTVASFIGTLASITGLIALARPSFNKDDIKVLEIESLSRLTKSTAELEQLEDKRLKTKTEIEELTRTKDEMDSLVKKAATALFLREELKRTEERIESHIHNHPELLKDIQSHEDQQKLLTALNEEIRSHKDTAFLNDIMRRVRIRPDRQLQTLYQSLDKIFLIGPVLKLYVEMILLQRERSRMNRYYPSSKDVNAIRKSDDSRTV